MKISSTQKMWNEAKNTIFRCFWHKNNTKKFFFTGWIFFVLGWFCSILIALSNARSKFLGWTDPEKLFLKYRFFPDSHISVFWWKVPSEYFILFCSIPSFVERSMRYRMVYNCWEINYILMDIWGSHERVPILTKSLSSRQCDPHNFFVLVSIELIFWVC